MLKDRLQGRNVLTRSVSTYQAAPSSPVQKNNPKSQLLKILSKSSSNISLIGYSKPEYDSKASIGEKFNRKTNAVVLTSGKKILLKTKTSDIVPHKSSAANNIPGEESKDSSKNDTVLSIRELTSDTTKGKSCYIAVLFPNLNFVFRSRRYF